MSAALAFLFDVDNTLLDNDAAKVDLAASVEQTVGAEHAARFWQIYEEVRHEREYVDYLRALAHFRAEAPYEPGFPALAEYVLSWPYQNYRYPHSLAAIANAGSLGATAILSDGDPVYQAAKIARAGLAAAVENRVFIYVHKQEHLHEVMARVPAQRYVLVDDKPDVLAACKVRLGEGVVTVHVRQGKYAHATAAHGILPPDLVIESIGDLVSLPATAFGVSTV